MNNDEIQGKADQLKGRVKKAVGDLSNDPDLHDEGTADEASGQVQEAFGTGKRKLGEAVKDLGDKIKQ